MHSVHLRRLVDGIPARILASEVDSHESLQRDTHGEQTDQDAVTLNKARTSLGKVDETGKHTTEVTETDVHGDTDTALGGSADVVAVPGDTLGHVGVDAACEEEGAGVFDVGVGGGDQEDQTCDGEEGEADHEDAAGSPLVCKVASSDAAETGDNVGRDGHELGSLVCVTKSFDDGWEEEGETVEWGVDAVMLLMN